MVTAVEKRMNRHDAVYHQSKFQHAYNVTHDTLD